MQRRDLRAELEAREREHFDKVRKEKGHRTGLLADKDKAPTLRITDLAAPATTPSTAESKPRLEDVPATSAAAAKTDDDELALYDDADDDDEADDDEEAHAHGSGSSDR